MTKQSKGYNWLEHSNNTYKQFETSKTKRCYRTPSSNFSSARGIQVQAQNAVNTLYLLLINQMVTQLSIQSDFSKTLIDGATVRYSIPTSTKHVDYNTFSRFER